MRVRVRGGVSGRVGVRVRVRVRARVRVRVRVRARVRVRVRVGVRVRDRARVRVGHLLLLSGVERDRLRTLAHPEQRIAQLRLALQLHG